MPFEKDPNERGALWDKTSSRGTYMTGTIDGQPVVVFRNTKKAPGSKGPDWRVLRPTPKPERTTETEAVSPEPDDSIPF